jgi:hypothetical protein
MSAAGRAALAGSATLFALVVVVHVACEGPRASATVPAGAPVLLDASAPDDEGGCLFVHGLPDGAAKHCREGETCRVFLGACWQDCFCERHGCIGDFRNCY